MKNKKINIIIIILVIVAIGACGYFYLANKNTKQTFTSKLTCEQKTQTKCVSGSCENRCGIGGTWEGWIPTETSLGCESMKDLIFKKIEAANSCSVDTDCAILRVGCPFGCGQYIGKNNNTADIIEDINSYRPCPDAICEYKCQFPVTPICVEGKCVADTVDKDI